MDVTADELAGVVDLFGGLTRAELERALAEAAFRADGGSVDREALAAAIDRATAAFALLRYERGADGSEPLFVAGPTAFPATPDGAEDLPHILDVDARDVDRERLGEAARERFERAVEDAIAADDADRGARLLDASYDLEAWAPVDLAGERERLDALLADDRTRE